MDLNTQDIEILNATVAFSVVIYYLFLYIEKTQIDTLTSLFNRDTYYRDLSKMDKDITGVIQYDMNGLKFINDNYGNVSSWVSDKIESVIYDLKNKNQKGGVEE